jgi:hypothetical protein
MYHFQPGKLYYGGGVLWPWRTLGTTSPKRSTAVAMYLGAGPDNGSFSKFKSLKFLYKDKIIFYRTLQSWKALAAKFEKAGEL